MVTYDFPEFVDHFDGLPIRALSYSTVKLQCNPGGTLHRVMSTYDYYWEPEAHAIIRAHHVGLKGRAKLEIKGGVGVMGSVNSE